MTVFEVKKALVEKLNAAFPNVNIYAREVIEDYKRPAIFTTLKPVLVEPINYNSQNNQYCFYIDYIAKTDIEVEALKIVQQVHDLCGLYIKVGKRTVNVTGFDFEFIGKTKDKLEIAVDLQWTDKIKHEAEDVPLIERVQTNIDFRKDEN